MKDWGICLAARCKDGEVDDDIRRTVSAADFEEAYLEAKKLARLYQTTNDEVEEVRIWNICIIDEKVF